MQKTNPYCITLANIPACVAAKVAAAIEKAVLQGLDAKVIEHNILCKLVPPASKAG